LCKPSRHNAGFQETHHHSLAYYEVAFMQDLTRTSFKNILFITDFSPAASPALAYSLALARHFHARLYPAHVMEDVLAASTGNHDKAFGLAQEQTRRQLLRLVEYNGVGYEPLLSRCDFENAMHHWIAEYGIDLIVVGTQGHTGRQGELLGGMVPPELTAYGPPALADAVAQVMAGTTLLGQGLSCPTSVPTDELYPPWARKSMVLKLFSGSAVPGTFSGKMYSRIGA
jgi:nucleotide-binding universal stress UspA family protein